MSSTASDVGKHVPALASSLRPTAQDELAVWGGPRLVRGKRVLDLGCGDAALARTVEGLDPDPEGIAAARKRARDEGVGNVRFEVGAAQSLPYKDGAFDVVISSWTL